MASPSLKAVAFALAWISTASLARAQCLELQPGFRVPGPSDRVEALASADLGAGASLFAGGAFTDVEGSPATHVAAWDGEAWSALGAGVDDDVLALCPTSAFSGPRLFVGGRFEIAGGSAAARIAAWDGASWTALGSGLDGAVDAILVFDDGSGPALYVGGEFGSAGGAPANHVARWDGSAWSEVGDGLDGHVNALCIFDDGSGAALYAGGSFVQQGGSGPNHVARWTGAVWAAVGTGLDCTVETLAAFDAAGGPLLCAGGCGVQAWDGATWSELGVGSPSALSLIAFDEGSGPVLYAGDFSRPFAFDGTAWNPLPSLSDASPVLAFAAHDDGTGTSLYAGGEVFYAPIAFPLYLARFDGSRWIPVGTSLGTNDGVRALIAFDDGGGDALYAAGLFTTAGSTPANRIARLDGDRWSALDGGGIGGPTRGSDRVQALASYDDGSGPAMFAAGAFSLAGGSPANDVARWDGSTWSALGTGLAGGVFPIARAMATFDDGSGTRLYVGGSFSSAGGIPVANLAAWDGASWSDVGGGLDGDVICLVVFDDGSGPALYVGGDFTHAGGVASDGVARWDGTVWSSRSLATGILAMAVHDDGTGPALYAGGALDFLLHRWNGVGWTSIPAVGFDPAVTALATFDDGSGPRLFATPGLLTKGEPSVYRWDGKNVGFVALLPVVSTVSAMLVRDGPSEPEPSLWFAFDFPAFLRGMPASGILRATGCSQPGVPFCAGASGPLACPCGNTGLPGHGCQNSALSGGALLSSTGRASLADDTLVLRTSDESRNSISIVWQAASDGVPQRFGDGLACIGGTALRMFKQRAFGGSIAVPGPHDLSVSAKSAALGDVILPGARRIYEVCYRDWVTAFCPPPNGGSFNASNALSVYWHP